MKRLTMSVVVVGLLLVSAACTESTSPAVDGGIAFDVTADRPRQDVPLVECAPGLESIRVDRVDPSLLQGCNWFAGNVNVPGMNAIDTRVLAPLRVIGGLLYVIRAENFVSFSGCESLEQVGHLSIVGATALESVEPLRGLPRIEVDLEFTRNTSLTTLSGLENLESVGRNLSVLLNPSLTSLSAMSSLRYIGGNVSIHGESLSRPEVEAFLAGIEILGDVSVNID